MTSDTVRSDAIVVLAGVAQKEQRKGTADE